MPFPRKTEPKAVVGDWVRLKSPTSKKLKVVMRHLDHDMCLVLDRVHDPKSSDLRKIYLLHCTCGEELMAPSHYFDTI